MDRRAKLPPRPPQPNPTVSYWQDPPSDIAHLRSTSVLPKRASVVVIGSGVTGTTTALKLLSQPSAPSVILLEARTACSGATGRNGGHTKCASYRSFLDNVEKLGQEEAVKIIRLEYHCMKSVHDSARENAIDCDSWQGDTADIIYDDEERKLAQRAIGEIKRLLGEDDPVARYEFWSSQEAKEKFLTDGALGAVTYEAGSLSPYKFVIGLLRLALAKGLNMQTNTPVLAIRRASGATPWLVETNRGIVEATKVVLATNGYTAGLYRKLQGVVVPLRGHMTAQRPGSNIPITGLSTTYSFIYHQSYEYMISRPQGSKFAGDIMIGGGSTMAENDGLNEFGTTDDTTTDPVILDYLKGSAANYFGANWGNDHPDGRIRKAWTGIMGYSADGFPFVGEAPEDENLFIAASFQGHGMVLCFSSAEALVEMMTRSAEDSLSHWFPKAFCITKERLKTNFEGRLHNTTPKELEVKSQL
ncbi:hypothetical protein MMC20_003556 [Loxospora ochrophaea]|nr:hypothetical protein [Loxospora ochrophaea]